MPNSSQWSNQLRFESKWLQIINRQINLNGSHWTALIVRPKFVFYFDSYGVPPCVEIIRFCKKKEVICSFTIKLFKTKNRLSVGFIVLRFYTIRRDARKEGQLINILINLWIYFKTTKRNGAILKKLFEAIWFNIKRIFIIIEIGR